MNDYLSKPIQVPDLIAALNRVPPHYLRTGNQILTPLRAHFVTEDASSTAAVDPAVLTEIVDLMGDEGVTMVRDLVQLFLQNSPLLLEQLWNALNKEDVSAFFRAVHTLRSPAAQVGASRLAKLCQEIEKNSEAIVTRCDGLPVDQINAEYALVRDYFLTTPGPWSAIAGLSAVDKGEPLTLNEGRFT